MFVIKLQNWQEFLYNIVKGNSVVDVGCVNLLYIHLNCFLEFC
jgi:hypothetical protein